MFLAGAALLDRRNGRWAARPLPDIERLLRRAYNGAIGAEQVMRGLAVVASALDENNLCLAQIAAVQLRLPDLPDRTARLGMEAEDGLIARERAEALARAAWDLAKHPRAGVPPDHGQADAERRADRRARG